MRSDAMLVRQIRRSGFADGLTGLKRTNGESRPSVTWKGIRLMKSETAKLLVAALALAFLVGCRTSGSVMSKGGGQIGFGLDTDTTLYFYQDPDETKKDIEMSASVAAELTTTEGETGGTDGP